MKRCGKHMSEARAFCALAPNHKGECSKFPANQGVKVPTSKRVVPAQEVIDLRPEKATVVCMGWSVGGDGCGAKLKISELTYIQTHCYTEPYSCSGGDYWNAGEGQFVCPKCGKLNRLYDRPDVEALRRHFKEIKDTYDK